MILRRSQSNEHRLPALDVDTTTFLVKWNAAVEEAGPFILPAYQ